MRTERESPRRRVLIGAYACGPVAEPEARAGWEFARAAAVNHDVCVITRPRFRASIANALDSDPDLASRLCVEYVDLPDLLVRLKRRSWDLYWFYLLWQRAAGNAALSLHSRHPFDLAHHITFANDWMPSGLTALADVPLVWGPVGGSSQLPIRRMAKALGIRGTVTEIARKALTTLARRVGGDPTARRARLVVAQNSQVAEHFAARGASVITEPNAALDELPARASVIDTKTAVFAGRLLAWKGARLAIDAIAQEPASEWRLRIFGEGYDEPRLRRRAEKLGVGNRVEFAGHRPRAEVLAAIARAEVFLFPSMHDQAGWVVAEASSIGCPVVCLPLGGPPLLAEPNAHVASLEGNVAKNLARMLVEAAATGGAPTDRWSVARLPEMVSKWYSSALEIPDRSGGEHGVSATPVRVLESFGSPKSTTNPYITQLYRSLKSSTQAEVLTFAYRTAIFGRYDAVHLHWPELLVGGHNWRGRTARRVLATLTTLRWRLCRTPIVRTLHNLERPTDISAFDHRFLDWIDALTTVDIRLNDHTPARPGIPATTIPHGHYRDWFSDKSKSDPVPGRLGYVGLIRRYKGVEDLIGAFREWQEPSATLRVSGKPSTHELIDTLMDAAEDDNRVSIDARYLDDAELVRAITAAELIVLPYRHMHNSGTALAALSLDRAVLVPDNEVNRALSDEVGPGWVLTFAGELRADDLSRAHAGLSTTSGRPDLSRRDWDSAGESHVEVFRRAVALRDQR